MTESVEPPDGFLTPGEVAAIFRVDPKTVSRWCLSGQMNYIKTPGGHRRILKSEVKRVMEISSVTHP